MSKEKLTVESIGKLITYDMCKYKSGEEILINLLEQIREDLIQEFNFDLNEVRYERLHKPIEKVFNRYLNSKGGK